MTRALIEGLGRSATYWNVVGGYSGQGRAVVMCTIHRPQVNQLKYVVQAVDAQAFLTIGVSHQAFGGGFGSKKSPARSIESPGADPEEAHRPDTEPHGEQLGPTPPPTQRVGDSIYR
jgi:hypothetical protein